MMQNMFADPGDQSGNYNTQLTPREEAAFQAWAAKTGRARDTYDYDLRGAWKNAAQAAGNGHLPDTYKKPNHPTFSAESNYSSPQSQGGNWVQGVDGKWMFFATPDNLKYRDENALQTYFQQREPDSRLVPPVSPNMFRQRR